MKKQGNLFKKPPKCQKCKSKNTAIIGHKVGTQIPFIKCHECGHRFYYRKVCPYTGELLPRGVSYVERSGGICWYARIGGKSPNYIGAGEEGWKLAVAARKKFDAAQDPNGQAEALERANFHAEAEALRKHGEAVQLRGKTVNWLCDWYLSLAEVERKASFKRYRDKANNVRYGMESKPLADLTTQDLRDYHAWRQGEHKIKTGKYDLTGQEIIRTMRPASNRSVQQELDQLIRMFRKAVKEEAMPKVPIPAKPAVFSKDEDILRRLITDDEFKALHKWAKPHGEVDEDFQDIMTVACYTAMRANEILQMEAGWISLDEVISEAPRAVGSFIYIPKHKTKSRYARTVPFDLGDLFPPELREVIEKRIQGKDPGEKLFPGWKRTQVTPKMKACCYRAGIQYGDKLKDKGGELAVNTEGWREGVVFHGFKSTAIVRWIKAGVSEELIRQWSAHKSIEVFKRYAKVSSSDARAMMAGFAPRTHTVDTKKAQRPAAINY